MTRRQGKIWTDDAEGPNIHIIPTVPSSLDLGSTQYPFRSLYLKNQINASGFNLLDGSDKNYSLSVYSAGTSYVLTAVSSALDFGTTDPVLVLNKAGTYSIQVNVNLQFNAATFASSRVVTVKLRRTNNTPADIANASTILNTGITSTVTGTLAVVALPPILYTTTNTNDSLTIFGDVSVVPTAGNLQAVSASILATRVY